MGLAYIYVDFCFNASSLPCLHPFWGRYKTWTLDSGLDYGLDYGLNYGLDFGLSWIVNSVLELLFKEDFECCIAQ